MHFSRLITLISCLFFATTAFAQETVVQGKVTSAENGEALPFATLVFTNTGIGTTTDIDGNYTLKTKDLTLKNLTISYVGFELKEIKVNPGKLNQENIKLKEIKLEIDVVEIRAKRRVPKDTAAIELYRNVVRNKYRNDPTNYEFYEYDQYSKTEFGLYNVTDKFKESKIIKRWDFLLLNIDTTESGVEVLPILLKENAQEVHYRKSPNKLKTITTGDKFSGVENFSISDLVDYNFEDVPIYGNLIRINGKPIMSPFADNARFSYKYFLTDTAVIDGLTCYKLEFTGRGNAEAAFTGHAYIHDSTFAIQSIRLYVLESANINFVSDFVLQQDFELVHGKFWFKNYEFMQTEYNIFKKKGEEKQSFLVRKETKRNDISVNKEIPDSVFSGEPDIIVEGGRTQDDEFWKAARSEQLSKREENIYTNVDSIKDSRFYKSIRWFTYLVSSGWVDAKYVEFGKFYQFYSWNAVEGGRIRVSMKTNHKLTPRIQFTPHFAYGLKDKKWKYGLESRVHLRRKNEKWHMLGAAHTYDMAQSGEFNPILRPTPPAYDNIGLSLLRKDPLDDLFLLRHSKLWYEREWVKGINTRLGFDHQIYESVPTGKIFTTSDATTGDTTAISKFTVSRASALLVFAKDMKFYDSNFGRFPITSHKPVFWIDYKIGIKNLFNSDYNYHSLQVGVRQRLLSPIGFTLYTIEGGATFGSAPYPVLTAHPGNESFIYSKWTYQAMNESEFISNKYASIWMVHHFDGFIFDKIPGIKKLKLRSLIGTRVLYGHIDKKNQNVLDFPQDTGPLNGVYAEVGVGLENILKILRVDFWFRMTQRDKTDISKWAFKLYLAPAF